MGIYATYEDSKQGLAYLLSVRLVQNLCYLWRFETRPWHPGAGYGLWIYATYEDSKHAINKLIISESPRIYATYEDSKLKMCNALPFFVHLEFMLLMKIRNSGIDSIVDGITRNLCYLWRFETPVWQHKAWFPERIYATYEDSKLRGRLAPENRYMWIYATYEDSKQ